MSKVLIVLFFLATPLLIFAKKTKEVFFHSGHQYFKEIILFDDNSYEMNLDSYTCSADSLGMKKNKTIKTVGKFQEINKNLILTPKYQIQTTFNGREIVEQVKSQTKLDTIFFKIIEYQNIRYLFRDNNVNIFEINQYVIPNDFWQLALEFNKSKGKTSNQYAIFRSKNILSKQEKLQLDIKNKFPEKYKNLILDNPIKAKATIATKSIPSNNNFHNEKNIYMKLNVGKKSGVYEGLIFFSKNKRKRCTLVIYKVMDTVSYGYIIEDSSSYLNCTECKTFLTYKK